MNIEQVNSRPVRWYTLLGLVLVPLLVAGGFLVAGMNSDSRLRTVQAAVVNLDEPVTVDGQYIPLGRQLTANLVDSDRVENLDWTLETEARARAGLATGQYAAMVLIPKNFSAAATSYAKEADEARRATIELSTSPVAGVADATLGKAVALAAASSLNETLTSTYLENIYVGFNDLGKQFTTMSDAASQLSDGTTKLAGGIGDASDGTQKLYTGARQLADGLGTMKSKTSSLPSDTKKLAGGVSSYVDGANQLAQQTIDSLPGQAQLAGGVKQLSQGAAGVSSGLAGYQSAMDALGSNATVVGQAKGAAAAAVGAVDCPTFDADPVVQAKACAAFKAGLNAGAEAGATVGVTVGGKAAAAGLDTKDPSTGQSLKSGAAALAGGLDTLNTQVQASVPDVDSTTKQLRELIAGGKQLASGTQKLADGMPALASGIAKVADGADQLASGVDSLGAGLISASSGADKLADGMSEFADGIAKGKDKLPSYTKAERQNLADVVASPVATEGLEGLADPNVGWVSLLAVVALWLGALGTYTVVRAVARGLLGSAESTPKLIAKALLPGLVVVGVQAVLLGALVHVGLGLAWPKTFEVTGVLLVAAAAFAVLNHALVALMGGFGRLLAVVFAVVTTASTVVAAAPGALTALRPFSPLTPALDAVRAVLTESSGAAASTWLVVGWLLLGLLGSAIAITRRRTTTLAAAVVG